MLIDAAYPLVLGSARHGVAEMLSALRPPRCSADIDEDRSPGEPPLAYLERIAAAKPKACERLGQAPHAAIPVADTNVVIAQTSWASPRTMCRRGCAGSRASRAVCTSSLYALRPGPRSGRACSHGRDACTCAPPTARKFALRGHRGRTSTRPGPTPRRMVTFFIGKRVEGSYSNVIGLPACEVSATCARSAWLAGRCSRRRGRADWRRSA